MTLQRLCLCLIAITCALGAQRSDAAVLLDFNLSICDGGLPIAINDYYAGGFDCAGVQGPDYGVTFTSGGVFPDNDGGAALVFEQGIFFGEARLEMPAGFQEGIAFRTSQFSLNIMFVVVLGNEDGVILSELIGPDSGDPGSAWTTIGLGFQGTATWARFYTTVEFPADVDDLTLGSTTVIPIPAAGWLLVSACLVLSRVRSRSA